MSNRKYLYAIRKFKIKPWLKYWILNKEKTSSGVLSEILTGTSFTLENSLDRLFNKFDLEGNTLQDGSPTPDSPIAIQNVSGSNTIKVQNKNLYNPANIVNYAYGSSGGEIVILSGTIYKGCYIECKGGDIFSISRDSLSNNRFRYCFTKELPAPGVICYNGIFTSIYDNELKIENIIVPNEMTYIFFYFTNQNDSLPNIQIELGSTASDYVSHAEQNLPVNLKSKNLLDATNYKESTNYYYSDNLISSGEAMIMSFTDKDTSVDISGCYIGFIDDYAGIGNPVQYRWVINNGEIQENKSNLSTINNTTLCKQWFVYPKTALATLLARYNIQIELGSTATTYEPYWSYEISKIETAEDFPFKAVNGDEYYDSLTAEQKSVLTYSKWYIHKEENDLILDGSQLANSFEYNSNLNTTDYNCFFFNNNTMKQATNDAEIVVICNKLLGTGSNQRTSNILNCWSNHLAAGKLGMHIPNTVTDTTALKTWLTNNPLSFKYILATPTNTEITETSLINQLEAIKQAKSYNEQTNISQTNEDLPFIIDVQYWKKEV